MKYQKIFQICTQLELYWVAKSTVTYYATTSLQLKKYVKMIETDLTKEEFMEALWYLKRNKTPSFDGRHANVTKYFCKKKLGKNNQVQKLLKMRKFPEHALEPEFHPGIKKFITLRSRVL